MYFNCVVLCILIVLSYVFLFVWMCTVLLPPGDNPIAVNKYINMILNVATCFNLT